MEPRCIILHLPVLNLTTMDFRMRPKSDYPKQASWQQLYALTRHWQSDLQFYGDEIHFFQRLNDSKLVWLEDEKNIQSMRKLHNQLAELSLERIKIEHKVKEHLEHVTEFERQTTQDVTAFREEHALLEDQLAGFAKTFRNLKKELFDLVERAADTEPASAQA